jgi:Transposase.
MASVFWDAKGVLLIYYLPTGQTIMKQYYVNFLDQIQEKIHERRQDLAKKKVIFCQDNVRLHPSIIQWQKSMN